MGKKFRTRRLTLAIVSAMILTLLAASSVASKHAVAQESRSGICGPMDIAFAVDDTGSMGGAINNVKSELPNIISTANSASGGDLRLGLMTFKDNVNVVHKLTGNIALVQASIGAISAGGGANSPEASDIAKETSITNLNGFDEPWRGSAVKIMILITDAPPGGLNDIKDAADVNRMHNVAVTALAKGVLVSDVFVPTEGDYDGQRAILQDDASTSGGVFTETAPTGEGTGAAISEIIKNCGKPVETVCSPTNVQHWDKIVFKINSTELAKRLNLTAGTELDIKVLDNPKEVADIKNKVLDFLGVRDAKRETIQILDVEYAIICAKTPATHFPIHTGLSALMSAEEKKSSMGEALRLQGGNVSTAGNMSAK
jgi:hypothetical protein